MSKTNEYFVRARYNDPIASEDNENGLRHATSNYYLVIEAEDMKKAYDKAVEYAPVKTEIQSIELNLSPRGYKRPYPYED